MRWCMLVIGALLPFGGRLLAQGPDLQFELCVKQFDEFQRRFNGIYETGEDTLNAAPPPDRAVLMRTLMAKDMDSTTARVFIASVMDAQPTYELVLDNRPWFANVTCLISDTVRQYPVKFWLVREKKGLARKWSILSSDMTQDDGARNPFIHSRNHETGFTDLLKVEVLAEFGVAPYVGPPGIHNLFALQESLQGGIWTIDQVENVRMHLLQVPGWFVEVEYRPPPARQGWITSGWNIVRLQPMSDAEKTLYVWKDVLGL
jgi:hypothetical protein